MEITYYQKMQATAIVEPEGQYLGETKRRASIVRIARGMIGFGRYNLILMGHFGSTLVKIFQCSVN